VDRHRERVATGGASGEGDDESGRDGREENEGTAKHESSFREGFDVRGARQVF